jgi:hypothetical protein
LSTRSFISLTDRRTKYGSQRAYRKYLYMSDFERQEKTGNKKVSNFVELSK